MTYGEFLAAAGLEHSGESFVWWLLSQHGVDPPKPRPLRQISGR